jgi:hypothetical protein
VKAMVLLTTLFLAAAALVPQKRSEDFDLPELHKIQTVTLAPSYGCRSREYSQRGYENTALFLTSYSRRHNAPELLFNGTCGGQDDIESSTAGDEMDAIADLGEIPLEKVTAHLAFNTRNVHSFELYSKFTRVAKIQPNHTYAVLIDRSDLKSLFAFTVTGYVPNKELDLRYAVKQYQRLQITAQSPGFDWEAESKTDPVDK